MSGPGNGQAKRPILISILCMVVFVMFALNLVLLPATAGDLAEAYGIGYVLFWITCEVVTLISTIGYWRMRRWGVYLYVAAFVIGVPIRFILGKSDAQLELAFADSFSFTVGGLLVPLLVILVSFLCFKRMV